MIAAANAQLEQDQQAYEDQLSALDSQLNALLGIDTSVLSLGEAIDAFRAAQLELESLNYDGQVAQFDEMIAAANAQLEQDQQAYDQEIQRLDQIISDNEALLNAALGIDNSVSSVELAVVNLGEAVRVLAQISQVPDDDNDDPVDIIPPDNEQAPDILEIDPPSDEDEPKDLPPGEPETDPEPEPETGPPNLPDIPRDPSEIPGPGLPDYLIAGPLNSSNSRDDEVSARIDSLSEQTELYQREIVKATKQTAQLLQRIELNGLRVEPLSGQ